MRFALNEDRIAVRDMAGEFAADQIAPHAVRWDEEKHFPVDVMRATAKRDICGIYIRDDVEALQLHCGYGYLSEYGVEKIVRDLRVHQILEGTNEIMRLVVVRKMIEGAR